MRGTEENLSATSKSLADASKLRRAVDLSVNNSRNVDHMVAASLTRRWGVGGGEGHSSLYITLAVSALCNMSQPRAIRFPLRMGI